MKGVKGIKVLCRIMKYLVQTGVTPQLVYSKVAGVTDDETPRSQVSPMMKNVNRRYDGRHRTSFERLSQVPSLSDPTIILGSIHHSEMITFTSTQWNWHAQ